MDDLEWADVLLWLGHERHDEVTDETVDRIERAVADEGPGFVALHSAHYARPFKRLIDAFGDLGEVHWENVGEIEELEVVNPDHPLADGVEDFTLEETEMFGEPFDIPAPDTVVLERYFPKGGELRSVVTFTFDEGRGAYIRPGHETFRIDHHSSIQRIQRNAATWAASE